MTCRRVDVERVSFVSSKPFDAVLAAVEAAIGHPDMAAIANAIQSSSTLAEFEDAVRPGLGPTGLMLFLHLDHGAVLRKEAPGAPKIVRLLIGNPLIMKEMAKHVTDAGSYAPVTVLVDERPDGVHLTYDRMASFLAPYGNADALAVARDLDSKVERLLRQAAE
jgi:uncharacterized protein (DUF302 family)